MVKYIIFILVFSYSNLVAKSSTNKYRLLGIDTVDNKKVERNIKYKYTKNIDIKEPKSLKKSDISPIEEILKYAKFKKISNKKSLCGICMGYKVSKRVKLSVDILAEINRDDNSISIEDKKANIRVAMSL
jgi:hypothetical protein